ncbi:MAG: hypothetical protein WAN58_05835 [Anaerolineales bacterium]
MNNIIGLLFIIIFGGLGLISIFVVINLLLPVPIERTRAALETSPARSLLLGLINFLCVGVLDALLIWLAQLTSSVKVVSGILVIIGGLITLALTLLAFLGLASLADLLGQHMGEPKTEFQAIMRGGVLLLLAALTPFIGWFAFTPLVIFVSLGAAIQAIVRRNEKAA